MVAGLAHGRVNLIGEHTDHSDGFVLPVLIPQETRVELEPRRDRVVRVTSANVEAGTWHEHELGSEEPTGTWTDHVRGVTRILAREGLLDRGFVARVSSDVPLGAGLASSAALAVALLRAIRQAFALDLDDVALARVAQRAEREMAGANVGIMDQMAASVGALGEALFLDCRSLAYQRVPLPDAMELVVVDSGVVHRHGSGGYNERRAQCEEAARLLGVAALRDVTAADLPRIGSLREPLARRARHVVSENERVLEAVHALRAGDVPGLGELLDASHRSLRDDFEVSTEEVDLLVGLVREQEAVHGARITGGGFGGSIVAVADAGEGHHAAALAVAEYEQRTGLDAKVLLPPHVLEALAGNDPL
ncbi:MAG: galactokinase [Chloroflexota bacterium]|nr:galactokinase [Chloroflexota bacterium]